MDNRPIGVFDSGLGGLAVVKQLKELLPNEQIVYFGDTGRVPYGTRSIETLHQYTAQDCNFLLSHNVKLIVAACGTVSSTVSDEFIKSLPVPFVGVIAPTAAAAAAHTASGHIGVIGTDATIKSGAFSREILKHTPAKITTKACPLFVSLVENGLIDKGNPTTRSVAEEYLSFANNTDMDTLILGCTHFPILTPVIEQIVGTHIALIDPGIYTSLLVADILKQRALCADKKSGADQYFVSDRGQLFGEIARLFMGQDISDLVITQSVSNFPTTLEGKL